VPKETKEGLLEEALVDGEERPHYFL